jgi:two-component system sensor histidine kinase GlrK
MLIGFTIVAAPLLFAIVNAAVQMNRLSIRSQQLVVQGMQGTRNNQRMFEEIGSLERTARLYQIIGSANLMDDYARRAPARSRLRPIDCSRICGMRRPTRRTWRT